MRVRPIIWKLTSRGERQREGGSEGRGNLYHDHARGSRRALAARRRETAAGVGKEAGGEGALAAPLSSSALPMVRCFCRLYACLLGAEQGGAVDFGLGGARGGQWANWLSHKDFSLLGCKARQAFMLGRKALARIITARAVNGEEQFFLFLKKAFSLNWE